MQPGFLARLTAAIIIFWLGMTGWLIQREVVPMMIADAAPALHINLLDEVEWTETNRRHKLTIRGLSADADRELFKAEGEFEVGRPPGTPHGMSQLFQVAMNVPLQIPEPGSYTVEASVDDGAAIHSLPFLAVAATV